MFDHDLQKRYEHVYAPEGEAGVMDVLTEPKGRCVAVTIVFYDRKNDPEGFNWVPKSILPYTPNQDVSPRDQLEDSMDVNYIQHGLWETGVIVAQTPATRGLIQQLREFDRWAPRSIAARGHYLAQLIRSLRNLSD